MKRILSMLLAAFLMMGLALAEGASEGDAPGQMAFAEAGVTLRLPESWQGLRGTLMPYGGGEIVQGMGVYYVELLYLGMTPERYQALRAKGNDLTDEEAAGLQSAITPLLEILAIDRNRDFDALNQLLGGGLDPQAATEIKRVGDCTFYSYASASPGLEDSDFSDEYASLAGTAAEVIASADYYVPVDVYTAAIGRRLDFETTDIDGNPVSAAELFGGHEITLLNVWATWCGPCVGELAELEAISGRLAEADCAVVGLLFDAEDAGAVAKAKALLAEKGVTYTVILPPADYRRLLPVEYLPTSYLVDRSGTILDAPIVGARVEAYEPAVQALLAGGAED